MSATLRGHQAAEPIPVIAIGADAVPPYSILMLAGGGNSHRSGGVGTLIDYLGAYWNSRSGAPIVRVLDTRGPGGIANGAAAFARTLLIVIWECLRGRVTLLHAHMTTRGSVVRKCLLCWTANVLGVPTIIHQHGADFQDYFLKLPGAFQVLIRAILNRSSSVVVLGKDWRDFLVDKVGVEPGKVRIIANGVPCIAAPDNGAPPRIRLNILFLGRLGDRKGVPELLRALGQERVLSRPWHAILAGDGEVDRFRKDVLAAGLGERIEIRGWQSRACTTALFQAADIMVLPSHHEAMPVAILEALSHGVPVIATPVGVIPEFLRDGRDAILVAPGNVDQLAAACITLMDDRAARAAMGVAGHKVFLETLDISQVAERLLSLYREAGVPNQKKGTGS